MESSRSLVDLLGVEDPSFFQQWSMNYFDELTAFGDGFFESFQETKQQQQQFEFSNKRSSCQELTEIDVDERAIKTMRTNSFSSPCEIDHQLINQFPNSNNYFNKNSNNNEVGGFVKPKKEITRPSNNNNISTISFPSDHHVASQAGSFGDYQNNNNYGFKISEGAKRVSTPAAARLPQVQDHIMAERRRREKLSQRFIALSALIPNLQKMDKGSVLGDGIKYLKQLKEKVKKLEEQARKKSEESVIVVKRHELYTNSSPNSSYENSLTSGPFEDSLPEIEARFSDKDVLIRIHCEIKKGVLEKVVNEIEKLHLSVINTSSMTFSSALHIVVIAQMNTDFSMMTVMEFMKNLQSGLKRFI
ncbi:hypothetical protein Leryth_000136 [Lithospermum erythrorhizon]|nr:hypothetical protein Leryth_000136 [Lithospermum erythrorhizon]